MFLLASYWLLIGFIIMVNNIQIREQYRQFSMCMTCFLRV